MNMPLVIQSHPLRRRAQPASQRAHNEHPSGKRPRRHTAHYRYELAPFQLTELHPLSLARVTA
jgi:hypothetical protein